MSIEHPDQKALTELFALPYSVRTQSEIAKLLNKGSGDPINDVASEEHFERIMMFLSLVSSKVVGVKMSFSHSLATGVLGRIAVSAMSAQALYRNHEDRRLPFLDHSSIAVLCRSIIESSIMYWYLVEEVSEEEWKFRYQVLSIHDTASRVRLFKTLIGEEAENQRSILKTLREDLVSMPLFKKRPEQQRARLRAGEVMYVNGMRSVVGSMNFDEEYFDSVYNYLSAYTHSSPLSYFRESNYHDFKEVIWRRSFTQYALHHAWIMMVRAALREMDISNLECNFDVELVKEVRLMASRRTQGVVPK